MTRPADVPEEAWKAGVAYARQYLEWLERGNSTGSLSPHAVDSLADTFARSIMAERQRIDALVDQKAQAFTASRNPLSAELVSALDDLRFSISRGEQAAPASPPSP